jgi:hypothetical protein
MLLLFCCSMLLLLCCMLLLLCRCCSTRPAAARPGGRCAAPAPAPACTLLPRRLCRPEQLPPPAPPRPAPILRRRLPTP